MINPIRQFSIKQIYDISIHSHRNQFGLQQYLAPGFGLSKQSISKTFIKPKLNLSKPKLNGKTAHSLQSKQNSSKIGPGSYFKTQKLTSKLLKLEMKISEKSLFNKQKRASSYLPKITNESKKRGPCDYEVIKAKQFLLNKTNYQKKKLKTEQKRRVFPQQVQAASLQTPSVGEYNFQYAPLVRSLCLHTKWDPRTRSQLKQLDRKRSNTLLERSNKSPSPAQYNLETSFSQSVLKKIKANSIAVIQGQKRQLIIKGQKQKIKSQNKQIVGPGRYLALDNWKNHIDKKKGYLFLSKPKAISVYRN